jgi:hypothetical protein
MDWSSICSFIVLFELSTNCGWTQSQNWNWTSKIKHKPKHWKQPAKFYLKKIFCNLSTVYANLKIKGYGTRLLNFANSDMAKCFRSVCEIWYRHDIFHNIRFSVRYEECPDVGPDAQRLVQAGLLQDKASHLIISNHKCCESAFRFDANPDLVPTSHFDADPPSHYGSVWVLPVLSLL